MVWLEIERKIIHSGVKNQRSLKHMKILNPFMTVASCCSDSHSYLGKGSWSEKNSLYPPTHHQKQKTTTKKQKQNIYVNSI